MAHVRSVEQPYWTLSQQYVRLWAAEKAGETARAIVEREETQRKAGRGTAADVAEARQRLEQFHLDVVTRTSDVITAERQLRNILGLPPADNRRIVPVSAPVETKLEPDGDEGRITIDRYLDAGGQYANAVAPEAQYKTAYNISIVALEEAKGTLLEHEKIAVAEPGRIPSSAPTGKPSPPEPGDSRARAAAPNTRPRARRSRSR